MAAINSTDRSRLGGLLPFGRDRVVRRLTEHDFHGHLHIEQEEAD